MLWARILLMALCVAGGLGLNPEAYAQNFALKLDPKGLTPSQLTQINPFLRQVEDHLPQALKNHLARSISVRFENLDSSTQLQLPVCLGDQPDPNAESQRLASIERSWGQDPTRISELLLSNHLKAVILAGERGAPTYACGHRNAYRLALASAIHEIGHIYDYADIKSAGEKSFLARCAANKASNPKTGMNHTDPQCRILKNRLRVSNRPAFLDLMGWVETGLIFHSRGQSNQITLRSPDPYEFKNWKESFAVNLEYFVLDPEFACRRPAVHAFYSNHFGYDPFPSRNCQPQTTMTLGSDFGTGKANVVDINPERVYEIHALFAGKGPQVMSKWGHSLYRLVICAPDRKKIGPECLNDVTHHVAISFRANVSDASISYLKGLNGDYPSLLFAQSLLGVIEEYNKSEFRELTSLPLRLTEQEKRFFIYRTLEAFWEYGGRYKFITNNCATEALNFLKGTLGESRLNSAHPLSPLGLHKTLQKLGIVDASVLNDRQNAIEKGYYYSSKKPEVQTAFNGLQKAAVAQAIAFPKTVEQYLDQTSSEQRKTWFEILSSSLVESRQIMASRF